MMVRWRSVDLREDEKRCMDALEVQKVCPVKCGCFKEWRCIETLLEHISTRLSTGISHPRKQHCRAFVALL